jgi:hypothetical protein
MPQPNLTVRKVPAPATHSLDEQLWPIYVAVVVLGGSLWAIVLSLFRLDDPRVACNAVTWLTAVTLATGVTLRLVGYLQARWLRRTALLSLVLSLIVNVSVMTAMAWTTVFGPAWMPERPTAVTRQRQPRVFVPEYMVSPLREDNSLTQDIEKPVETGVPAADERLEVSRQESGQGRAWTPPVATPEPPSALAAPSRHAAARPQAMPGPADQPSALARQSTALRPAAEPLAVPDAKAPAAPAPLSGPSAVEQARSYQLGQQVAVPPPEQEPDHSAPRTAIRQPREKPGPDAPAAATPDRARLSEWTETARPRRVTVEEIPGGADTALRPAAEGPTKQAADVPEVRPPGPAAGVVASERRPSGAAAAIQQVPDTVESAGLTVDRSSPAAAPASSAIARSHPLPVTSVVPDRLDAETAPITPSSLASRVPPEEIVVPEPRAVEVAPARRSSDVQASDSLPAEPSSPAPAADRRRARPARQTPPVVGATVRGELVDVAEPAESVVAAPARMALSRSAMGIAGVGASLNLDRGVPAPDTPVPNASASASRRKPMQDLEPGPALAPSLPPEERRLRAGENRPLTNLQARDTEASTLAGARTTAPLDASASAVVQRAAARAPSGPYTAAQGATEIDVGPARIAADEGRGAAAGGGQPLLVAGEQPRALDRQVANFVESVPAAAARSAPLPADADGNAADTMRPTEAWQAQLPRRAEARLPDALAAGAGTVEAGATSSDVPGNVPARPAIADRQPWVPASSGDVPAAEEPDLVAAAAVGRASPAFRGQPTDATALEAVDPIRSGSAPAPEPASGPLAGRMPGSPAPGTPEVAQLPGKAFEEGLHARFLDRAAPSLSVEGPAVAADLPELAPAEQSVMPRRSTRAATRLPQRVVALAERSWPVPDVTERKATEAVSEDTLAAVPRQTGADLPAADLAEVQPRSELEAPPQATGSLFPQPDTTAGDSLQSTRFVRQSLLGSLPVDTDVVMPTPAFRRRQQRRGEAPADQRGRPSPRTEAAIEKGLLFLSRHQATDGSWSLHDHAAGKPGYPDESTIISSDTAATGLALLSFLGAGYHHKVDRHGPTVRAGLDFLLRHQSADGDLYLDQDAESTRSAWLYSHGIATIAICEAFGMTQDDTLREPAQRAIDFIVAAQHPTRGGWRYAPGQGADTSVTGWMVMALKSGELAGLAVPAVVYPRVEQWMELAQGSSEQPYVFRYNPFAPDTEAQRHGRRPTRAMTAVGLLLRLYLGWRRDDESLLRGGNILLEHLPAMGTASQPRRDTYYWYYATQVMFQLGGSYWQRWHDRLHPLLVETQVTGGPLSGSWDPQRPVPDRWGAHAGRLYVTTMNLLSLEVYYRHLPLYEDVAR